MIVKSSRYRAPVDTEAKIIASAASTNICLSAALELTLSISALVNSLCVLRYGLTSLNALVIRLSKSGSPHFSIPHSTATALNEQRKIVQLADVEIVNCEAMPTPQRLLCQPFKCTKLYIMTMID